MGKSLRMAQIYTPEHYDHQPQKYPGPISPKLQKQQVVGRVRTTERILLIDATCYESYIRFPTYLKLPWESGHLVFEKQLYRLCRVFKIKRTRSKYGPEE